MVIETFDDSHMIHPVPLEEEEEIATKCPKPKLDLQPTSVTSTVHIPKILG